MKRILRKKEIIITCVVLCIISFSCHHAFTPNGNVKENHSYCNLLHVPGKMGIPDRKKPYLGIVMGSTTGDYSEACDTFIKITGVIEESSADDAGLQKNDIILSANGAPICESGERIFDAFKSFIERQDVGNEIQLDILREGEEKSLAVRLRERPFFKQAEAYHERLDICTGGQSTFEVRLRSENKLSLFRDVRSELEYRSNLIHNTAWILQNRANPYQLREFTYLFRHPMRGGEVAREVTGEIMALARQNDGAIAGVIDRVSRLLNIESGRTSCEALSLTHMMRIMEQASNDIEYALRNLTEDERTFIRTSEFQLSEKDRWNRILELSLKVELKELLSAFTPLLSCLDEKNLASLKKDVLNTVEGKGGGAIHEMETAFGKVLIGGIDSDTYDDDAALILDPGGDDIYLNNAGATREGLSLAIVVDWEGDDMYLSQKNISQGTGVLGGGFLIDLGGDDVFRADDGSQGTGYYGIGMLYNRGERSSFFSETFSQGMGLFGVGLLWNSDSGSIYRSSGYGQALGYFNGVGILIDEGGNDYYLLGGRIPDFRDPEKATVSMGQGFGKGIRPNHELSGVSGGIGILIDGKGDDIYVADYFAQGASYYYGVGILDDYLGDDRYFSGRYAQGSGIHSSVGIFIDREGNDTYQASHGVAQGVGHDYGVGYLEDLNGNDRYIGGVLAQGAATSGSIGIILDREGRDLYTVKSKGQAYVDDDDCLGIMLDLDPDQDALSGYSDRHLMRIGGHTDNSR